MFTPDSQLVIRVDLSDWDPLVVRPDGRKLPVRVTDTECSFREEAAKRCVVGVGTASLPGVICNLCLPLSEVQTITPEWQ